MIYAWFFVIGLIFGSFVNVLIYRFSANKYFWRKRSYCPLCDKTLTWYELIPLLSFFVQLGRCRGCRGKISWQYPVVEITTGLLFTIGFWHYGWQVVLLKYLIFCVFGLALSFIDGYKKEVPDQLSVTLILLLLVTSLFTTNDWWQLAGATIIGAGFFAVIHYASKGQWMGDGDIRLGAIMGLIIGNVFGLIVALGIASITASIYGLVRNAISRRWIRQIAFGPFLLFGAWLALFLPTSIILKMVTII